MGNQILAFQKNKGDLSYSTVVATASQGDDYADWAINRSPRSAWITSGSVDADNTTFELDFGVVQDIDNILLLRHNFKAFTIQYWDGDSWEDFSTPISQTTNTASSNRFTFTSVATSKVLLTITGTQTANEDKYLYHFIATEAIGQFEGWPQINRPILGKSKVRNRLLSGKSDIFENLGHFACSLSVKSLTSDEDLTMIETMFDSNEGFLLWLCGGSESQFKTVRQGYRLQDIYLMKPTNDFSPEYLDGIYSGGIKFQMDLVEVVT